MIATMYQISKADCIRFHIVGPYDYHRLIYSLFPKLPAMTRDFVFLDKGEKTGFHSFLIFSQRVPQDVGIGSLDWKEVPEVLFSYETYRFSVRMNPVERVGEPQKVKPIIGFETQRRWFLLKTGDWGFSVITESLDVSSPIIQEIFKGGRKVSQQAVTFAGVLQVEDPGKFRKSIEQGIGRSKSFGFGLLEVVPID
jgi:CRISPR system Cascade subunit CasE